MPLRQILHFAIPTQFTPKNHPDRRQFIRVSAATLAAAGFWLSAMAVEGTDQRPMPLVMQGYEARLSDSDIAELTSFLRQAWGNDAAPISQEEVTNIREQGPTDAQKGAQARAD